MVLNTDNAILKIVRYNNIDISNCILVMIDIAVCDIHAIIHKLQQITKDINVCGILWYNNGYDGEIPDNRKIWTATEIMNMPSNTCLSWKELM